MMKKTIILVKYGMISEIAELFGISTRTVRRALKGDESVTEYEKIRKCALEKGGAEMQAVNENKV